MSTLLSTLKRKELLLVTLSTIVVGCANSRAPLQLSDHSENGFCTLASNGEFYVPEGYGNNYSNMTKALSVQAERTELNTDDNIADDSELEGRRYGKSVTSYILWRDVLNVSSASTDLIYDYGRLLYEGKVLPKRMRVITGNQEKDANIIVENGLQIKVIGDFVPVFNAPSWRNFFPPPPKKLYEVSVPSYIGASSGLSKLWNTNFNKGYEYGVCFTLLEFQNSMKTLANDYNDRFLYLNAERHGLVMPPRILQTETGIQVKDGAILFKRKITKVREEDYIFNDEGNWGKVE